jgi:hypothetical protein
MVVDTRHAMRLAGGTFVILLGLAGLDACKGKPAPSVPAGVAHVPGTPHTDEVLAAWRNAGLAPEGFTFATPPPGTASYCERGLVRGVETTVCEYADEQALGRGAQQVKQEWARVDVHTGVILRAKRTTMVAIDRERREPSGKTISQMAKVFGKLP